MTVMPHDPRRDVTAELVDAETRDLDVAGREPRADHRHAVADPDQPFPFRSPEPRLPDPGRGVER